MMSEKNCVGGVRGAMGDRGKAWSPDLGSWKATASKIKPWVGISQGRWCQLQGEKTWPVKGSEVNANWNSGGR